MPFCTHCIMELEASRCKTFILFNYLRDPVGRHVQPFGQVSDGVLGRERLHFKVRSATALITMLHACLRFSFLCSMCLFSIIFSSPPSNSCHLCKDRRGHRSLTRFCTLFCRSLNVVHLYDVFEDDKTVYLVMDLCSGGELW